MPSFNLNVLITLVLNFLSLGSLSEAVYLSHDCSNTTSFTPNSTYEFNLNLLLSSLASNATRELGFYNTTAGSQDPTTAIYGSFLCRGDLKSNVCRDCVATATRETIQTYCPFMKIAIIWYEDCMLRYSNVSFFGNMEEAPRVSMLNVGNITDPDRFNQLLAETITGLVPVAANAASGAKKFATKEANFTAFQQLYSLVQCTPDLSSTACDRCLRGAIALLPACCDGKQGGRVLYPSCNIRYEIYPFYASVAAPPPPPTPLLLPPPPPPASVSRPQGNDGQISSLIIVVIVVSSTIMLFLVSCCFFRRRARKKYKVIQQQYVGNAISSVESLQFDLRTIEAATDNFSDQNRLGEGGFGEVYKGTLADGQQIAVKRLSSGSGQGAEEFKNEVVLVAKLQHRNLVRLLGFCSEGEEKILVYELVENKSLDHFLFGLSPSNIILWEPSKIGLVKHIQDYWRDCSRASLLHQDSPLKIIHRDLKASNILLDGDMNPKIADFGMARIVGVDQTQGNTRRIVGTIGYMSPEYAMHGQFSVKSDVYSLGVLILEIVTGKKNTSFYNSDRGEDLLSYAWRHWNDGTPLELLDPNLRDSYAKAEVTRCVHIGLLCVQEIPDERPTMQAIVLMLSSYSVTMALPQKPALFLHSISELNMPSLTTESSHQTTSNSSPFSVNEVSITELYPR